VYTAEGWSRPARRDDEEPNPEDDGERGGDGPLLH
jgi:hypothetical protein